MRVERIHSSGRMIQKWVITAHRIDSWITDYRIFPLFNFWEKDSQWNVVIIKFILIQIASLALTLDLGSKWCRCQWWFFKMRC